MQRYRYPGINSFDTTDEDIFFGRDNDRKQLTALVEVKKLTLLYARSGMGKSSLLKAALIPELTQKEYATAYIRLGAYQADSSLPPLQTLLRKTLLKTEKKLPTTFLTQFLNRTHSLWYAFKAVQVAALQARQSKQPEQPEQPMVLIFDQFEELFSYPPKQIVEFKQQLAELLYTPIPKNYLEALKDAELLSQPLTKEEMAWLYTPLQVKVVFSIRSDQMSLLNELTDYLPNVLKEFYELKPLTTAQALTAIVKPAAEGGDFATPNFVYREEAQQKILKALASPKGIDTAQLQIVLQYIEKDIVEAKQDYDLTAEDLGDLNKVYENYYHNSLAKLPNSTEKEKARRLIEDRLIVEGRRISYDEQLCLKEVDKDTLATLVETRLLRREPNSTDGFSYELSHDTLVKPVLDAKEQYEAEQARIREEQRKEAERLAALAKAEEERIEKEKTKRQVRILSVAFGLAVVAVGVALWFFFDAQKQKERALTAVKEARIARDKAEEQTQLAENAKKDALSEKNKAEAAKDTAELAQRAAEYAENKATQALTEAEVQKNKAEAALAKQVAIYQDNITEALSRFEIVEARGELAKVKQLGTDIVSPNTIAALEKQIADSLQKLLPEMVKVEGGEFMMGCTGKDTTVCGSDEKPVHKVQLNSFEIGKYEVTQALWQKIIGGTPPSYFKNCDNCPVESVSWDLIQEFLAKLEAKTGLKGFRLPTEAEWEYAARGGKKSKNYTYAGSDSLGLVAWYDSNSDNKTHPVGTKQPNELGLYDMSGNVWEWCNDWYDETYYQNSPLRNPKGAETGSGRVVRGGSWDGSPEFCRVANRYDNNRGYRNNVIGFRLYRTR